MVLVFHTDLGDKTSLKTVNERFICNYSSMQEVINQYNNPITILKHFFLKLLNSS